MEMLAGTLAAARDPISQADDKCYAQPLGKNQSWVPK